MTNLNLTVSHTEAVLALANGYEVRMIDENVALLIIEGSKWEPVRVEGQGADTPAFLVADFLTAMAACECGICSKVREDIAA